ncbi:hypothetical protein BRADI_4g08460v3 [Brachypodium distachyon]|uniref:Uncharacterized protein n=1 Tax=Brachypodium distachyon TaxID=15368 RepID=A0A0Q3EKG9_BRADI|nr:hypothetical protein BRADI_4g08460v3 [Brachypodium distachyon]
MATSRPGGQAAGEEAGLANEPTRSGVIDRSIIEMGGSSSRSSIAVVGVDLETGPTTVVQQPEAAAAAAQLQAPAHTNMFLENEAERMGRACCVGILLGCVDIGIVVMTWLSSGHSWVATLACAFLFTDVCIIGVAFQLQHK